MSESGLTEQQLDELAAIFADAAFEVLLAEIEAEAARDAEAAAAS